MNRFVLALSTLILIQACGESTTAMPADDAATGDDAAPLLDAAVPAPDAWSMPSCPGYATDVQPLYQRHCSTCHTTGRDARFGSSISVARSTTSACGTPMTTCVIAVGRVGGQMARNDPYGGFTPTDVATIQAWYDCGMPD